MTKGKAKHAMQCISFNPFYEKPIASIFGDVFICDDADIAQKVAFDPRVNMRCVTLDGTLYDPDGLMIGGQDIVKDSAILNRITEIQQIENDLKANLDKQSNCKTEIASFQQRQRDYFDEKQKVEVLQHKN